MHENGAGWLDRGQRKGKRHPTEKISTTQQPVVKEKFDKGFDKIFGEREIKHGKEEAENKN